MQVSVFQSEDSYWIFSAVLLVVTDFKLGHLITSAFSKIRDVLFAFSTSWRS